VPVAPAIDAEAADALVRYDWPGNVRELKQVLERALAFAEDGPIRREHLPRALTSLAVAQDAASPALAVGAGSIVGGEAGARWAEATAPATSTQGDVRASVKDFERERIVAALRETGGNRTRAAELLGLPRRTLVYKLSKMRLDES
jgi:DNA-binding NtrC family response regulator